jgi:hypothetical protein
VRPRLTETIGYPSSIFEDNTHKSRFRVKLLDKHLSSLLRFPTEWPCDSFCSISVLRLASSRTTSSGLKGGLEELKDSIAYGARAVHGERIRSPQGAGRAPGCATRAPGEGRGRIVTPVRLRGGSSWPRRLRLLSPSSESQRSAESANVPRKKREGMTRGLMRGDRSAIQDRVTRPRIQTRLTRCRTFSRSASSRNFARLAAKKRPYNRPFLSFSIPACQISARLPSRSRIPAGFAEIAAFHSRNRRPV